MLCFLALHGHQHSGNWLCTRFIMESSCINKFGTIPNCIFYSTCVCIHYGEYNSKCVSHVHTFAGLQKFACIIYLPHFLTFMVRLNNFIFFQFGPTMTRLFEKWFLVNDQRDAQIPFYAFIFICNSLNVSSTSCSLSGETNCVNTAPSSCHVQVGSELPTCKWHGHQHRVTAIRGCNYTICLSW